jgi:hypothetical protein
MSRFLGLALVSLALFGGSASANGIDFGYGHGHGVWGIAPGYIDINLHGRLSWGAIGFGNLSGWGGGPGGAYGYQAQPVKPYQLGPWYQYFPYEAHFQQPAMPQFPYWVPQTLPHGTPVLNPGYPGHGAVPPYWGG